MTDPGPGHQTGELHATDAQAPVGRLASGSQARELLDLLRRNRDFRRVFASAIVSFLGDWFSFVAVSGLVAELTGRDGSTAVVFALEVLPIFLLSPIAGVVADRFDRKRIMIGADLARVVPALGLLVAAAWGSAWLAYLCVALLSAMAAFFQPVTSAVLPNIVAKEDLPTAQNAMGSVWGAMLFVGAALGGIAAATLGRNASFALNALTFVVSALLLVGTRVAFSTGAPTGGAGVLRNVGEVWSFVRPRKLSRAMLTTKTGVGVGNGIAGLLPVYAITVFGTGDEGIGILFAARGLGAFLGPYIGRAIAGDDGRRQVLVIGSSIVSYAIAYASLPLTRSIWVASAAVVLAHMGGGAQWVLSTYALQLTTPDILRGRVMSFDFGLATLAVGLSALLAGGLAEAFGLTVASYVMVAFALTYGSAWLVWTRDLWRPGAPDPFDRDRLDADLAR